MRFDPEALAQAACEATGTGSCTTFAKLDEGKPIIDERRYPLV